MSEQHVQGSGPAGAGQGTADLPSELVRRVSGVLVGGGDAIAVATAGFLSGGHVLLEDAPGVGKTLLAKAMARCIGGSFGRVQGTPDLLPSDLTGVSVFEEDTRSWTFHHGPLFNHVVLVDELNRMTPRTQSALLEAMAERQVTVDGVTHPLPDPFFVIATQNPLAEHFGTFPLVSGQRDRFSVSLSLGLPGRADELAVLRGAGGEPELERLAPLAELHTWTDWRRAVDDVYVGESVATYVLDIIDVIRRAAQAEEPLSTRAALMLLRVARANALAAGRDHVNPDDVRRVAGAALSHRLVDLTRGDLTAARRWARQVVEQLPVPPPVADATAPSAPSQRAASAAPASAAPASAPSPPTAPAPAPVAPARAAEVPPEPT